MTRRAWRQILVCCFILTCVLTGSAGAAPKMEPTEDIIAVGAHSGASLYKQHCLTCHGADLGGKIGPNLRGIGSRYTRQELSQVISKGRGGMPGFAKQLSAEEIQALSAWVASQK